MNENNSKKGVVVVNKKDDAKSIFSFVLDTYIKPAIKKTISNVVSNGSDLISDVIKNGADIALYGEAGISNNRKNHYNSINYYGGKISYITNDPTPARRTELINRNDVDIPQLSFDNRGKAEIVRDNMYETLEMYGVVSVANMYEFADPDLTFPHTYNNYGWYDLRGTDIVNIGGRWLLDVPRPRPINIR